MDGMTDNVKTSGKVNRNLSLDAVKGFAILIVMIGHCIVLNGLADAYLYDAIAAVQMPLFMAVSGYLLGMRKHDSAAKPDIAIVAKAMGKRSVAYLVPFFVWLVITSFPHCFHELGLQLFQLDRGLWFLMTLWVICLTATIAEFVAAYVLYKVGKRNELLELILFLVLVFAVYILFFLQARSQNTFLSPSLTVRYMPFYMAGYAVKKVGNLKWKLPTSICIALCLISATIFVYLVCAFDMIVVLDTSTLLAQMLASFAGVYVCFYLVYHIQNSVVQRVLAFVGTYTLEIYVLHFRFARLLKIADKNLMPLSLSACMWVIIAFIVMSVLTAACIWIIKKMWILDFLLFGKIRSRNPK